MQAHSNKPQLSYEQAITTGQKSDPQPSHTHTLLPNHPPSYLLEYSQEQRKCSLPECCHRLLVCHPCCPMGVRLRYPLRRKSHLEGRQWHGETSRERYNIATTGMHRRGKLPPRTNGGTLTSTEARECSNATNVSSRSTTRFASAVATRTPKAQKCAPRKERSEHMSAKLWLGF